MSTVDLVIPSYHRPHDLEVALTYAANQTVPFQHIIVVARSDDEATQAVARAHGLSPVLVSSPGVLAAMAAGLAHATADIVAFTDDDARLSPTHCERIGEIFACGTTIAGVGGPDALFDGDTPRPMSPTKRVGQLTFWGRLVGNHHRGREVACAVAALKGVNAAYRRELLRLPAGLRGDGAQPHFEVAIGTELRARGYQLIYSTALVVAHHPAKRLGDDDRIAPTASAFFDSAYNLERSIPRRLMTRRLVYVTVVGDRNVPGIIRLLVATLQGDWSLWRRARPSWLGTFRAWRERNQPLRFLGE